MIRRRRPNDLEACIALLSEVYKADVYPAHWPENQHSWLIDRDEYVAWVFDVAGVIQGHIAVRSAWGDPVLALWREAAGKDENGLVVVSRLFVSPLTRGRGIGSALLAEAIAWAHQLGLTPVLDVAEKNTESIAFYEQAGWGRIGNSSVVTPTGEPLPVALFIGPPPPDE